MSISRSNKDQQRKLEAIKKQLYGKVNLQNVKTSDISDTLIHSPRYNFGAATPEAGEAGRSIEIVHDTKYLQKDLIKIFLLASLVIVMQLSLKFVLKI